MMINFTEIPKANGNVGQDKFEQFTKLFLEAYGYEIIEHPSRGADGGLDLKVKDIRKGVGNTEVFLLVSCKHYAHSNSSITASIETDIQDRVARHSCTGFIGFYSTIPNNSLKDKLRELKNNGKIEEYDFFDNSRIENSILQLKGGEQLFARYFPDSFSIWKNQFKKSQNELVSNADETEFKTKQFISKDDLIDAALTANIIIEIIKIKNDFWAAKWPERESIIGELYKYSEYQNIRISKEIIDFLVHIASTTRSGLTHNMSFSLDFLVFEFFPYSDSEVDRKEINAIAVDCIHMAQNIIYDATIHLGNLAVAQWALLTLKYIYQYCKTNNEEEVLKKFYHEYDRLEETLKRPERNDLELSQKLVKIYRNDLNEPGMHFPIMPKDLYLKIQKDEKK